MAEHRSNKKDWDKHTNRDKPVSKQEKTKNGSYVKGGSPKGRHNRDKK